MRRLWAAITWLPRWLPKEKPWRWRPFSESVPPYPDDGMWKLAIVPYFWWQRPGWDFNEFGVFLHFGSWTRRVGIRDND